VTIRAVVSCGAEGRASPSPDARRASRCAAADTLCGAQRGIRASQLTESFVASSGRSFGGGYSDGKTERTRAPRFNPVERVKRARPRTDGKRVGDNPSIRSGWTGWQRYWEFRTEQRTAPETAGNSHPRSVEPRSSTLSVGAGLAEQPSEARNCPAVSGARFESGSGGGRRGWEFPAVAGRNTLGSAAVKLRPKAEKFSSSPTCCGWPPSASVAGGARSLGPTAVK